MPVIPGLQWTFDTAAALYDRLRPTYPPALYEEIQACLPLNGDSRALEIGCGTGQATGPVLDTGCRVTAVELGRSLAALAAENFRGRENFRVVNCAFEDYDAPEASFDLVYSASAFHWIPEELGYRRVYALLRPGGVFARFANHPLPDMAQHAALHRDMQKVYARYMGSEILNPRPYSMEQALRRAQTAQKYGFEVLGAQLYTGRRTLDAKDYVALLHTYSDHIVLPREVQQPFYEGVGEAIERHGGRITLIDTADLALARRPER